ncbi:hypothetical protein SI65_08241 [Aspergillus cristatus]|uniref:Anaphase-promoting complex subunit 4 WD40 domain-containing protein n=1 Tax=Aspergillus cristatus TaxID=573508 RepID=A0A1E3B5L6_ASPCR|nr:hypothetical protein SI65_08241 [Aspergillus cristatus]
MNERDLIVHLNPASSGFKEVEIVKTKESASKFVKFSRSSASDDRVLWASDSRIVLWQLSPLQQHAEIENIEPGALNIDFGGDENEVIVFHAWNTKLTIYSLDTGRSQIIKTPKSSHYNNFGYRPKTRQFAIILKPDANDLLTIHEFRSYELIRRAVLPTVDAQGLKWSPDGRWIAIWDTASTGTKVLVYTADGQPFRTYTGPPELDDTVDLGVKNVQWSPVAPNTGASEYLAVGKVDGTIDLLKNRTFTCAISLAHVAPADQNSFVVWREQFTNADCDLEYTEVPGPSAPAMLAETSAPPRGVSIMSFSSEGSLLTTVDQTRPNIVWVWTLGSAPGLFAALYHEHPVKQVVWHPSETAILITTANNVTAAVHYWSPNGPPVVVRVPVSRSESGKYDVRWLSSGQDSDWRFWFGTPDDYVLGDIEDQGVIPQFRVHYSINSKAPTGSLGTTF